jgi:hypothetical protein
MKRIAFPLFLLLAEIAQVTGQDLIAYVPKVESNTNSPYVREINYLVETVSSSNDIRQAETMYCLYVGSKKTERIDQQEAEGHSILNVSLVHPVPTVTASLPVHALKRWYAMLIDSQRSITKISPLFEERGWSMVPVLVKHILSALGADDEDLILIAWNGLSGSTSIFYHPRFNDDKAFYEGKRKVLVDYMETHDIREDVSLIDLSDAVPKTKVADAR